MRTRVACGLHYHGLLWKLRPVLVWVRSKNTQLRNMTYSRMPPVLRAPAIVHGMSAVPPSSVHTCVTLHMPNAVCRRLWNHPAKSKERQAFMTGKRAWLRGRHGGIAAPLWKFKGRLKDWSLSRKTPLQPIIFSQKLEYHGCLVDNDWTWDDKCCFAGCRYTNVKL